MKINRLYIENFLCYSSCHLDFSKFSSALILGKINDSDSKSNGAGKTTIFKAIEYVLFNKVDIKLESIIRDDTDKCIVSLDFEINGKEYRLIRSRNRKGTSDLNLLERTDNVVEISDVIVLPSKSEAWLNISSRRTSDTENDLFKLIKINYEAFKGTVYFMQRDMSGLTTVGAAPRKALLKEMLGLAVYSKLEKIAKEEVSSLSKKIDKNRLLIDSLGEIDNHINDLKVKLSETLTESAIKESELAIVESDISDLNLKISELNVNYNSLSNDFKILALKNQVIWSEKDKLETTLKDLQSKKVAIVATAKSLIDTIKDIKEKLLKISEYDFNNIDILQNRANDLNDKIVVLNVTVQNNMSTYSDLNVPLPNGSECNHCRQPLSDTHRKICQEQINEKLKNCQEIIKKAKVEIVSSTEALNIVKKQYNQLISVKKEFDNLTIVIEHKEKDLLEKRAIHEEIVSSIKISNNELEANKKLLEELTTATELQESIDKVSTEIKGFNQNISLLNNKKLSINKELSHLNNTVAVINHNIDQKNSDNVKKITLSAQLKTLEEEYFGYSLVLTGFSPSGIPSLIIQNVLDDLQIEANNMLNQIKPGLQLGFIVEKTKDDGTQDDTLDIKYYVNGKDREFNQLSGAMKVSATFSLKLGLSSLLQKRMGTDIKFLLLDEIEDSLDKAGVDAFADIVKFFQKDFTILVITHNDYLKDKFASAILVEQDADMISTAKIISL